MGQGGVVLGTGGNCSIRLPPEVGMAEQHVAIEWVKAAGKRGTWHVREGHGM